VTGGCGFVGRHFVVALLERGYHVTVVDDLSTGVRPELWPGHLQRRISLPDRMTFQHADFREYARDTTANFDLIVHLAAVVGGRLTIEGDPLRVATDLAIDAALFNWVVRARPLPRKVLYFSSSAAYPISEQRATGHRPLNEDLISFDNTLGVPDMTYGWSKLSGEYLARHAAKTYGLNVVVYRPFSGYGEDQDYTYPFPSIVRRVLSGESPIVIWGSGDQLRDFIYIEDVVEAVFATFEELSPGEALNLGSGVGTSFRALAEQCCEVLDHHAAVVSDPSKPEGVFARVADCTRLFKRYRPSTTLAEGIEIFRRHYVGCESTRSLVGS
jgi:GDP-L-fucose synthase